ncbi:MAG: hypothetical protein JNM21_07085 [Taibaiella sp.]|nr:hypothetical protein [Taibaiella sp.]
MNHTQHSGAALPQPGQSIEITEIVSVSDIKTLREENKALKEELNHKSDTLIELGTKLEALNESYEALLTVATRYLAESDKLKQQA